MNSVVAGPVTFLGPMTASSLDVAGTVSGDGFSAFFDSYFVTTLGKKENAITATAPLLKTAPSAGPNAGQNMLSLDTTATYTVGSLTVDVDLEVGGSTYLQSNAQHDAGIVDSSGADVLRAQTTATST